MADRVLRGSRLGAVSYETDRNHDLAPRQLARYRTENGEEFEVPFADDAEIPGTWLCKNGLEGTLLEGDLPEPKKVKPPRTHWDMLLERRSVEELDELLASVPGLDGSNGALYANAAVIAKIKSAGRRIGGTEMVREDLTGKRVVQYNGIPVLDPGSTAAGAAVLPQTETVGSSSVTSSIYAVRFGSSEGDHAVTGLTNGGVQVYDLGELQEKPALRTRIEFYVGLGVFGGRGAARLRGVLAA